MLVLHYTDVHRSKPAIPRIASKRQVDRNL